MLFKILYTIIVLIIFIFIYFKIKEKEHSLGFVIVTGVIVAIIGNFLIPSNISLYDIFEYYYTEETTQNVQNVDAKIPSETNEEISAPDDLINKVKSSEVTGEVYYNQNVLKVNPIIDNTYCVDSIQNVSIEAQPTNIIKFSGEILTNGQTNNHEFAPQVSGTHRFEFSNVPNGTYLRLRIYNSGWEEIDFSYDLDNGDGLTKALVAGEKYYICVEQYKGTGSYTLNIGPKKDIVDITNCTAVYDSIQYTNQENDYSYIAENDGTYRFEFSDVPNGTDFRLRIYNSGWEEIDFSYDLDNGDGLTKALVAGEKYYICVEQYKGTGSYTLNIGPKKETVNITNFTAISDNIQYTNQENDYSYVAENDGTYRFEFSNVPNGTYYGLRIYNSGWEEIGFDYDLDNGDGLTRDLTSGELYYIRVEQYRETGPYVLNIGPKKDIVDITNDMAVSDNIQYTDQENDYLFEAKTNGTYRFKLSNVQEGNRLKLEVFNSGWERINAEYGLGNDGKLDVSLSMGESYFVRVTQSDGIGDYILTVEQENYEL